MPSISTTTSLTVYAELATSTCTPLGAGSQRCTYEYVNRLSTTTSTTTSPTQHTPSFDFPTSTFVYSPNDAILSFALWFFLFLGISALMIVYGRMILFKHD